VSLSPRDCSPVHGEGLIEFWQPRCWEEYSGTWWEYDYSVYVEWVGEWRVVWLFWDHCLQIGCFLGTDALD